MGEAVLGVLCIALWLYTLVLIARIVLSFAMMAWRPPPALSPVVGMLYALTEPPLALFRRYIPPVGGLDISPIFVFLLIRFASEAVCV